MAVPEIRVSRTPTQATINIDNYTTGDYVSIYRADDYKGTFSRIATIQSSSMVDDRLDVSKNYKYKAAFTDPDSKEVFDSSAEVFDSSTEVFFTETAEQRSASRYTKGE